MKRVTTLILALAFTGSAFAAETQRYIIGTKKASRLATESVIGDAVRAAARRARPFDTINAIAVDLTPEEAAELMKSGEVRYVEAVRGMHLNDGTAGGSSAALPDFNPTPVVNTSPFDLTQVVPRGIDQVHARDVWKVTKGASNVHIAILDTGIDADHPDVKHAWQGGYNVFTKEENGRIDDHRHGTHVAGILAAADNGYGVVGIAPNVRLWAVKVLDKYGDGTSEGLIQGVEWVIQKQKEVGGNWLMNMSLGTVGRSEAEAEVFARATDAGIVMFAATGNRYIPGVDYPAAYPGVFGVGALTADLSARVDFSNFGPGLSIVAPGVDVMSSVPRNWAEVGDVALPNGTRIRGRAPKGSPNTDVSGEFVYCGLGRISDIPTNVAGKIAVVHRGHDGSGSMTFRSKVRNAKELGAKAVIIINDDDVNKNDLETWNLELAWCDPRGCVVDPEWVGYVFPLVVGIYARDGQALLDQIGKGRITASHRFDSYMPMDGTSMATPHACGAAALAWSAAPNASPEMVRLALTTTATNYRRGWDYELGYGMIDALAAAKKLNPAAFGSEEPPIGTPRRRGTTH